MIDGLKPYPAVKHSGVPWLGEVPAHWDVTAVRKYCRVFAGATPSRVVPGYWEGGFIPWLASGDVNCRRITGARQFITEAGYAASSTKWIRPGSLVIALAGQGRTKGMVATIECHTTCNQSLAAVEPSSRVSDYRFLAYYLESRYLDLRALVGDGLRDGLNLEHVRGIVTPLPPLPEQTLIVCFLDHVDRRIRRYIRAKQRLIKLLEEQKQAIIHRAVTRGLDPNVRLKPSGVEWLGDVPEHWEVVPLRWYVSIDSGDFIAADKVSDRPNTENQIPVIGGNGVMGYGAHFNSDGTTIAIGRVGALCGNVHLVAGRAWVTDNALRITWVKGFELEYLALQLRASNLNRLANANAQPLITGGVVKEHRVVKPPSDEQRGVVQSLLDATKKVDVAIDNTQREISLLREYRTRLIADVVTGKLDVREAVANLPDETEELEALDESESLTEAKEGTVGDSDAGPPEEVEA